MFMLDNEQGMNKGDVPNVQPKVEHQERLFVLISYTSLEREEYETNFVEC